MKYFVSDIHGEYELFLRLLERISFSPDDEMFVCGDIIEKGDSSIKLAKYISSVPNIHCIIGNHEYAFLKYYDSVLQSSSDDFDASLKKLQDYFSSDGYLLDWELLDWFESLPSYIDREDFICVHAGIPIDKKTGLLLPLCEVETEQLVYDRHFKEPTVAHKSPKCVFFGHTQTDFICGESKVIGYPRNKSTPASSLRDFYKIHLDTGTWSNGVLGCFCMDTLKAVYVKKG